MKIIMMLLLPVFLFSNEIKTTDIYKDGFIYYKNKKFQESYSEFSKIYLKYLTDIEFNFCFGRSAYETGHYEMAIAAFERVEIEDTSNLRNRLEMARTYFMLKMYEDSENAFKDVLANPNIPKNIRQNIELSLSKVSKVQKKSFTYARIMMGILYDSNINYGSIADYEYGGGTLGKIPEESDIALELYANATNIYDIGLKNDFAIKNSLSFYLKEFFNEGDYNSLYLNYTPSLLYKKPKYTFEIPLSLDALYIGDKEYLKSISITPTLHYNHTTTLNSSLFLKYQIKKFKDSSLNASRYEILYTLQNILSPRSYIQGNLALINETKQENSNIYINFNEYKFSSNYANQFSQIYAMDLYAQIRYRKYKDYSTGFDSRREDIGTLINSSFSAIVMPTWSANAKISYEYVQSNQERFTYQKYTAFIGIVKTF